ncbi:MAG: c-type cytochrome [Woeseiaceae bacterium]
MLLMLLITGHAHSEDASDSRFASVADFIKSCEVCHNESGASTQQQYPILAGQEFYYLYVQLKDFKSGLREGPIMGPLASALEKDEMQLVAQYFSEQRWPETNYSVDETRIDSALTVINSGQCVACHLGAFHGNSRVPRLAGQHPEYLAKTMLDFKSRSRNNAPDKGSLMATFDDDQILDVAYYLGALRD